MEDMIMKFSEETLHTQLLQWVFKRVRLYNMGLNLEKGTFTVRADNFSAFYLTK